MSVISLTSAICSLVVLAIFFRFLADVLNSPSDLRKRERDFDPDTISGWHVRNR
jgi:hypothetical protein